MGQRIVFCCALKNRAENLRRLLTSLSAMTASVPFLFSLADFYSTDGNIEATLSSTPFPTKLRSLAGYFNRSRGLNTAMMAAKADEIVFFLDADCLVPENFLDTICEHVRPGQCYFPICYSLHENKPAIISGDHKNSTRANGWWRKTGKGMCGFIKQDFVQLGKWNEETGRSYGKEDCEVYREAWRHLHVIREPLPGLFHCWHEGGDYRTKHHEPRRARR